MVRVLQYIGLLQTGGSQSFILELYRNMDRTKVQFDFIVFSQVNQKLAREIRKLGGKIYKSPQYCGVNHFEYQKWWDSFFHFHPEYQVLHGHVRSVAAIYTPAAKKYGLTVIVHSHSTSNGTGIRAGLKDLMQLPIRFQADYFFACSKEAGEWLFGRKACNSAKYRFVPNSIAVRKFLYQEAARQKVRDELNLSGKKVIGNAGRIAEPKNQVFLIEMMQYIPDDDVRLLIVGDGCLLQDLKRKAVQLGVDGRVVFTGARNDMHRVYQAMDVFVFPSLWEGLPVSLIEAQAGGLRCLVSDRVTRDVVLTKGIKRLPLEKGTGYWATQVKQALRFGRKSLDKEDMERLEKFDSRHVAQELQEFYLCCMKDMHQMRPGTKQPVFGRRKDSER